MASVSAHASVGLDCADNSQPWTNASNVTGASDGSSATFVTGNQVLSNTICGKTLGFSVPSNASINGIQTDVLVKFDCPSSISSVCYVGLTKSGTSQYTLVNAGSYSPSSSYFTATAGGPADLQGGSFTPAEVNAAGFGGICQWWNNNGLIVINSSFYVDAFTITVYYTVPQAGLFFGTN